MRYAPEHNDATRDRILSAASRLFREHGIAAVGLAKIMGEAGLTVGTFYTHFASKEALVEASIGHALASTRGLLDPASEGDIESLVRVYLSARHRDAADTGCPIAALAPEMARRPRATKRKLAAALAPSLDVLTARLAAHRGQSVTRAEATALFGLLMGTLQLARATPDADASSAILEAGIEAALRLTAPRRGG